MYDVIIVGAGPAGLFAAYELITKNKNLKVAILDRGNAVKTRVCPMNKLGIPCQNCNPCNILSGYGGAGTFSDGKLNYIHKLGKSDLTKYMPESAAMKLIDETEEIFNSFKMDAEVYPSNMNEAEAIRKKVAIAGAKLLIIKQKHLGSDHLPEYIDGICDFLKEKGVELVDRCDVLDITTVSENEHEIICNLKGKDKTYKAKTVVVAPGRTGAKWIQELADKYKIPYYSQSIEIGVRVEVRKDIMEDITNVIYDPTIFIKTKTYSDEIRTFCTNPGGFVAKENY
ncbi:MAG: FAD-dependent oxidoreductase, partial [Bacilli bacterium]|nr:FAD-dependent oxidoreductase [Bacilli bacterium]